MKSNILNISLILVVTSLLNGCASLGLSHNTSTTTNQIKYPKLTYAESEDYVVLVTKKGDSLKTLAKHYLGDEKLAWVIADFNQITAIVPRREIVIPLKNRNITGVSSRGVQSIPILCYHRFGQGHEKLAVSEKKFREQMQYLKDNHYNVIPMDAMHDFLENRKPLPAKSVIITIDDGYRSTYDIAYPILKSFNFPATLFLYTDFTGARDAVSWKQTKIMYDSGIIDIQPHSKSHPNMSLTNIDESQKNYKLRITDEVRVPGKAIKKRLKYDMHTFAYPYGDTNPMIIELLKKTRYKLGVTVDPGSNSAFAHPYMLQRTMIFGDHDLNDFQQALTTVKKTNFN